MKSNDVLEVNMAGMQNLLGFAAESKLPFCIWGERAVGKTTGVKDFCESAGYRCVVLHLATQDIVDLIGMPKVEAVEMPDGTKFSKTIWARPEWMKNDGIPTCYFLDEFNRGNQFVLAAMLPFLIEGTLHTHKIGEKDFVIAACNPSTGNYNVNDSFEADDALRDRCGHIILKPSEEEFLNYSKGVIGKVAYKTITKNKKYINLGAVNIPFSVEPSRRSIVNVMRYVSKKNPTWVRSCGNLVLSAYLGLDFCTDWFAEYTDRLEYLDLETLQDFDKNKDHIEQAITTVIKGKHEVKNDIFEAIQDVILNFINFEYKDGVSNIDWLFKFYKIPVIQLDSVVSMLTKAKIVDKPILCNSICDSNLLTNHPDWEVCNLINETMGA
jgi:hypothetical protein